MTGESAVERGSHIYPTPFLGSRLDVGGDLSEVLSVELGGVPLNDCSNLITSIRLGHAVSPRWYFRQVSSPSGIASAWPSSVWS